MSMKFTIKPLFLFFFASFCSQQIFAQYTVNGFAAQISCNEYRLTDDFGGQNGSVWNNTKIDLTQSFDYNFDVILSKFGFPKDGGADGIAFVLQPISTSVGSSGNGMGYSGISPAVGVTIDTYQNSSPDNDPFYDHIAIQLNGDINHSSANNIAGPVTAINGNNDIEDGVWHSMRIVWDAPTTTLSAYIDGSLRVSVVRDFVATVFGGNPLVYWGFTGSTGGLSNYQGFKTALNPGFNIASTLTRCVGDAVSFTNTTVSFTPVSKFYWDFGDGSPLDSVNANPVHTYTIYGDLTATLRVIGADGCTATFGLPVRIGTKPVAAIKSTLNLNSCDPNTPFLDSSYLTFGTINNWYWNLDDGFTSTAQNPTVNYANYGYKTIKLAVSTAEGCKSDTTTIVITKRKVFPDFDFTDSVCLGSPTFFTGKTVILPDGAVLWAWILDGNVVSNQGTFSYTFTTPGIHTVQLNSGLSSACVLPKMANVFVTDKPHAGIKKGIFCPGAPASLLDSSYSTDGVAITNYWWDLGNGQFSTQQNPAVTYNAASGSVVVRHVVTNAKGCISDTLTQTIVLADKPTANFGYSTPVCNGLPVQFSDSSKVNGGTVTQWSWVYNGTQFSTTQNPSNTFTAGSQTVKLVATSNLGCVSDTASKTFYVNPSPSVSINFKDACKFALVDFTAVDNSATVTQWKWVFGDGGSALTQNAQHTYTANGAYKVKLYATASNGCYSDSLEKTINIYGTNAFAGNDTIAAAGQPVQLSASGGLSYSWTPAYLLSDPNIPNPVTVLTSTQVFTLKASTPEGCESYDDVEVKIYKGPDIYLPTAFTPNGDGLNDDFKGTPVGIKQFNYLKVFNRWGQMIFSSADYNKAWDGKWKGEKQPSGVYVVMANGIDFKGNTIDKKQTVMLIR